MHPATIKEAIFQHSVLCQTFLPYRNPGDDVRVWQQHQGKVSLAVQANDALNPETNRFEFGASIAAYYKLNLMENVSMENILNLYSNYLDKPQNVDIDYQMNLVMKVNKYISTNLSMQAIYDDNTIGAFQVREVVGLGVNYGF